jgi:hypothetical protein
MHVTPGNADDERVHVRKDDDRQNEHYEIKATGRPVFGIIFVV